MPPERGQDRPVFGITQSNLHFGKANEFRGQTWICSNMAAVRVEPHARRDIWGFAELRLRQVVLRGL